MINVQELRIGSWVKTPTGIDTVFKLEQLEEYDGVNTWLAEEIEPIPLTPEWFKRLGFENDKPYFAYDGFVFKEYDEGWQDVELERMSPFLLKIKYVHQLQNLYFALSGQELTLS